MLLEFAITNFRSVRERQFLSMVADTAKNDLPENAWTISKNFRVLKTSALYGRNASGKSNFLKAFDTLAFLLTDHQADHKHFSCYEPFFFDEESQFLPTVFEINFLIDKIRYSYQFSFDAHQIRSESLYFYPKTHAARLFERIEGEFVYGDYLKGTKKEVEKNTQKHELFLAKAQNLDILGQVYKSLRNIIAVTYHDTYLDSEDMKAVAVLLQDKKLNTVRQNIDQLLQSADTGIVRLEIKEIGNSELSFSSTPQEKRQQLFERYHYEAITVHRFINSQGISEERRFSLSQESTGTQKLLLMGMQIFLTLDRGGIIVIDELEKNFHPLLSRMLIRLFHNPETNPHNAQMLFSTHDSSLLGSNLLRRDQIVFAEKEFDGSTTIYALSDFKNLKTNIPLDKWYLSGRFGATPVMEEPHLAFSN